MLGTASTLILVPATPISRTGRLVVGGAWAMVLSLYVANALSPDPGSMRYEFYFAAALTAIALGVRDHASLVRWARWTTRLIVTVSLGAAVFAPTWAFIGKGAAGYERTIFGIPRLVGLSPHPNALAEIAVTGLILEIVAGGAKLRRLAFGTLAVSCVILAQSNTGYIAAFVGIVTIAVLRKPAYRRALVTAAVVLLALYIVKPEVIVPPSFRNSDYVASVSGRTTIWKLSLVEWRRHPLTGYGPNVFSPAYLSSHFPPNLQATNGHDQLVQTLADSGLLGAASLALLLCGGALCAWRARGIDSGLSLSLLAAITTFGITETPLRVVGIEIVPTLAALGIGVLASRGAVNPADSRAAEALRARLAIPGTRLFDSHPPPEVSPW
jgi:O-antigen ligase